MWLEELMKANMRKTEHMEEASEKSRESLGASTEVLCEKVFKN